jgi:hypothetical protein
METESPVLKTGIGYMFFGAFDHYGRPRNVRPELIFSNLKGVNRDDYSLDINGRSIQYYFKSSRRGGTTQLKFGIHAGKVTIAVICYAIKVIAFFRYLFPVWFIRESGLIPPEPKVRLIPVRALFRGGSSAIGVCP